MKHTVSVLVANEAGVLAKVVSLFSRRGFNIESLSVGKAENDNISRITLVVEGNNRVLEQLTKQLNKLIVVHKISDLTKDAVVSRDLALIKVKTTATTRPEIMQIVDIFRGKIVDVASDSVMIEITGDENKVNAIEELLRPFGIKELVRTGKIAMSRGRK